MVFITSPSDPFAPFRKIRATFLPPRSFFANLQPQLVLPGHYATIASKTKHQINVSGSRVGDIRVGPVAARQRTPSPGLVVLMRYSSALHHRELFFCKLVFPINSVSRCQFIAPVPCNRNRHVRTEEWRYGWQWRYGQACNSSNRRWFVCLW